MIVGPRDRSVGPVTTAPGQIYVDQIELAAGYALGRLTVWVDGQDNPGSSGSQLIRAIAYDPDGRLIAAGPGVKVTAGQAPGWVELGFGEYEGRPVGGGTHRFGLQTGPAESISGSDFVRPHTGAGGQFFYGNDTYEDGPSPTIVSTTAYAGAVAMYLTLLPSFAIPDVPDVDLSALPWELGQRAFDGGVIAASRLNARAGWHGAALDPHPGAYAIARIGGPLEELVGERIRVTRRAGARDRSIVLWLGSEQEWPEDVTDEDFSITRDAWLRLAPPPLESIPVRVEVMS